MAPERSDTPSGVRAIEHTADLGLEIEAPSLPELFDRSAAGLFMLVRGLEPGGPEDSAAGRRTQGFTGLEDAAEGGVERTVDLAATDLPALLVAWLRELLYLHQDEGLVYGAAEFDAVDEAGASLRARVRLRPAAREPVREIKGVTYHQLAVARRADQGWAARVVFDV